MKPKSRPTSPSPRIAGELAALRRAGLRAQEIALQTNTALIFAKNGKPIRVHPKSER